jgi:hypothetical protein
MARLAAVEKGEYYPTPLQVVEQISEYVVPKQTKRRGTIRLLDPCAGKGRALELLGNRFATLSDHPIETWGVEISEERAAAAEERLDKVVNAPFQAVNWSPWGPGAASLLFLNPPYDRSAHGGRMETDFLKATTPALVSNGVLVLIIPAKSVNYGLASYLFQQYKDVQLFRFGGAGKASFEQFKQVVVLARKRREAREKYSVATRDDQKAFREKYAMVYPRSKPERYMQDVPDSLPSGTCYEVRPTRTMARLRRYRWLPGEVEEIVEANWEQVEDVIGQQILKSEQEVKEPLRELSVGHIAQVSASGLSGVLEGPGVVYTGRVVKSIDVVPHPNDPEKVVAQESWDPHIVEVTEEGLRHLSKPHEVNEYLQEHIGDFAAILEDKLQPYGEDITPEENAILDTLSLDKKLPNVDEPGLLMDQRLSAVAITRSIDRNGFCNFIGEMGYGKSRTTLASIELMDAWPALVVCPPIVIKNWRDKEAPAIPGLDAHIARSITDLEEIRENHQPGDKTLVVIPRSMFKLGPGWEHEVFHRHTLPKADDDEELNEKQKNKRAAFSDAVSAYNEARERLKENDDDGMRTAVATLRKKALKKARRAPVCPRCGKPIEPPRGRTIHTCPHTIRVWDNMEQTWDEVDCGEVFCRFGTRYHRWPLADYIVKKMPHFFKVFVSDEVHENKGLDSDRGRMYRLVASKLPHINLTGTFSDGTSSSIYAILHTGLAKVRKKYPWVSLREWIRRFGVMATTWKLEDEVAANVTTHGALMGTKRRQSKVKERPGINPDIVRYMLHTSLFTNVQDLGIELPPMQDHMVKLDMTDRQREDMRKLEAMTWDQLVEWWPHYTANWFQWSISRPNSAYRTEFVEGYKPGVMPNDLYVGFSLTKPNSLEVLAADMMGLTFDELVRQLRMGRSIAEVAADNGVSAFDIAQAYANPLVMDQAADDEEEEGRPWVKAKFEMVFEKALNRANEILNRQYSEEQYTAPSELLPKEEWLVHKVTSEVQAGRSVVVYVRQTGIRDIQPRIRTILEKAGIDGVKVMRSSKSEADERQGILEEEEPNVLIVNPKMVKHGLNLVMFEVAIFYEVLFSSYDMWQSCCRLWRPGQENPVDIYYLAYKGTPEERAYAVLGAKRKHAGLLHGKKVSSVLIPSGGQDSLIDSLITAIQKEKADELTVSKGGFFTDDDPDTLVSVSVTGSDVHQSQSAQAAMADHAPEPVQAAMQAAFAAFKTEGLASDVSVL